MGIGGTVGVMNDALYAGYGWDLTLNEAYWFIGTKLFHLATRLTR